MTKREARIQALFLVAQNTWGCLGAWHCPSEFDEADWNEKIVPAIEEIAQSLFNRASKMRGGNDS